MEYILNITENDFARLWNQGGSAGFFTEPEQRGRLEAVDEANFVEPDFQNVTGFWFGDNFTAMLLGREWLLHKEHTAVCMFDMATHSNGDPLGYVIFTNYLPKGMSN